MKKYVIYRRASANGGHDASKSIKDQKMILDLIFDMEKYYRVLAIKRGIAAKKHRKSKGNHPSDLNR